MEILGNGIRGLGESKLEDFVVNDMYGWLDCRLLRFLIMSDSCVWGNIVWIETKGGGERGGFV